MGFHVLGNNGAPRAPKAIGMPKNPSGLLSILPHPRLPSAGCIHPGLICFSPWPCFPYTLHTLVPGAGEPFSGLEDTRQQGTLTDVVEASGCQALWQVRGVEERGQEGHGHVLLVAQDGFVLRTLPGEQEQLQAVRETSGLGRRPAPFSSPEDVSAHVWTPSAKALTSSGCGWERELRACVDRIPVLAVVT